MPPLPPQDVMELSRDECLCVFPPDTTVCQSNLNPQCSGQTQAPWKMSLLSPTDVEDFKPCSGGVSWLFRHFHPNMLACSLNEVLTLLSTRSEGEHDKEEVRVRRLEPRKPNPSTPGSLVDRPRPNSQSTVVETLSLGVGHHERPMTVPLLTATRPKTPG